MTPLHVVILPDHQGELCVCDVDMLTDILDQDEDYETAVLDSAIDTIDARAPDVRERLLRVYALNATGDTNAYWDIE